jgi:lysophospholipase L1-like esterase
MSGEPEWRVLKDIRFRTDSYGYRNEPGAEEVPVQFIALGDSFGVGNGTSQEKIWPVRLEKIRGERVYNLSMSGSPWRELMILKSEINRLPVNRDSIVLWMLFTGNDLEESTCSKQDLETLPKASRWESLRIAYENYRWRSPLRQLILRAFKGNRRLQPGLIQAKPMMNGYPLLFYKPHFIAGSRPREDILTHPHSTCLKETIREMSTFVKERNQKLMVFVIPTKEEVYAWVLQDASPWKVSTVPSGFSEVVEELCREFGIEFYNLKKDFVHYAEKLYEEDGRLLWWPDDTHWNDQGHALVAQLINARLPRTHPE